MAESSPIVKLALPKGRMQEGVFRLLAEAGVRVRTSARGYRPQVAFGGIDAKILKPQSVVEMVAAGSRDIGFAGADWVGELGADVVELLDTRLDAVRVVAAAPAAIVERGVLREPVGRPLLVASEYVRLTRRWAESRGRSVTVVRSYGATEVFPPEDADAIVDVAATGDTLREQNLIVFDELLRSSTRLYANSAAMADPLRRGVIDRFTMLLRSVVEARDRVMVEVNVTAVALEAVVAALPCMREPTIATLHGSAGFAVKAAVPRDRLASLIPEIKARGGTDIVVSQLTQIIP